MNILKSIGIIFLGILITVIFSNGTDFVLEYIGIFPAIGQSEFDAWMYVLAIIYRTFYSAAAGYVTATLAPDRPMRHVIILGIIGTIAAALGVLAAISQGLAIWYPVAIALLAFPSVWAGGKMQEISQSADLSSSPKAILNE